MRNNSHESYFGSYFYGKYQQLLSCKAPEGTEDRAFLNDLCFQDYELLQFQD